MKALFWSLVTVVIFLGGFDLVLTPVPTFRAGVRRAERWILQQMRNFFRWTVRQLWLFARWAWRNYWRFIVGGAIGLLLGFLLATRYYTGRFP